MMIGKTPLTTRHLWNGAATTALLIALTACAPFSFGNQPAAAASATAAPEAGSKPVPATASAPSVPAVAAASAPGADTPSPEADLDAAIAQAKAARGSGDLHGAARILSQLVLYAPDDPRVLGEYGKTLVAEGRSDDALAFLERAIQLMPADWTLYSAQGVAYDQKTEFDRARISYGRALALKPGEPAVLNNAALSRMQAGDLDGAEKLLLEAQPKGAADPRIAENLALVKSLKAQHKTASAESAASADATTASEAKTVMTAPLPPLLRRSAPALEPVPMQAAALRSSLDQPASLAAAPKPVVVEMPKPTPSPAVKPAAPGAIAETLAPAPKAAPKPATAPAPKTVASTTPVTPKGEVKPLVKPEALEPKPQAVKLASLEPEGNQASTPSSGRHATSMFYVQAGAYSTQERADQRAASLDRLGAQVTQATVDGRPIFRVRIGPFLDIEQARVAIAQAQRLGYSDVRIVSD
jgi:Flp pilus assembly protein TadD